MHISVHFYSYFKDLTGCEQAVAQVSERANIEDLLAELFILFPKLQQMQKSMLIAVGVDYQPKSYRLNPGDQVSLFPPVQGG